MNNKLEPDTVHNYVRNYYKNYYKTVHQIK